MHQFLKAKNSKKTLHSRKEKGLVPFRRTRIPCSFCKTIYFATGPICLQHHLFVESYMNYYCSFCSLIHIKHVFIFFNSCYCISYNNTLESFLDEINFFHAMPKYDVIFIINPIWHCSLSEKQCVKICCGIPCQIVM